MTQKQVKEEIAKQDEFAGKDNFKNRAKALALKSIGFKIMQKWS